MQFVEKNSFNVRSAVCQLKSTDSAIVFLLFPMVHIGSKEFYAEVSRKLAECDLVLAEGVGNSRKANLLTLSYRIVRYIRRMDLVTQQEGMNVAEFRHKIVGADITGQVFDSHWSSLPLVLRLQLFLLTPIFVIYLLFFGTRETIAENIAVDDLQTSEEILFQDENIKKLDSLLIDKRDRKLIEEIEKLYHSNGQNASVVAIVDGAFHMRNVTNYLMEKLNYRITGSEWLTIFDL
jgi:hypothetical protein